MLHVLIFEFELPAPSQFVLNQWCYNPTCEGCSLAKTLFWGRSYLVWLHFLLQQRLFSGSLQLALQWGMYVLTFAFIEFICVPDTIGLGTCSSADGSEGGLLGLMVFLFGIPCRRLGCMSPRQSEISDILSFFILTLLDLGSVGLSHHDYG